MGSRGRRIIIQDWPYLKNNQNKKDGRHYSSGRELA
jgi:hypothetical protein